MKVSIISDLIPKTTKLIKTYNYAFCTINCTLIFMGLIRQNLICEHSSGRTITVDIVHVI